MVHHIHAFTIHVTVLILLKGVLYARSSKLIPLRIAGIYTVVSGKDND
jgi:hypothetical protein